MPDDDSIPMVDLHMQYQNLRVEINDAVQDVLDSCEFVLGPNVQLFEQEAAAYLDCQYGIACASGTDALHLALRTLEIGAGDEVIVPAFSFASVAEAIAHVGATPVFCDIEPYCFNLDVAQLENLVTSQTRAILAVHLYGHPADLTTLDSLCKKHGLFLIEDCAQAFGATFNNRPVGGFGNMGCFSFFPSKNLGAYGDGGLVTTQSPELAEKLNLLRNHGSKIRNRHETIGFNSRLDEIQAAILRVKLKYIDESNHKRRIIAGAYNDFLDSASVVTPSEKRNCKHVFQQYTILTEKRDQIQNALALNNIACAVYYPAGLHEQTAFRDICRAGPLSVTERVCKQCLSLPMYPELDHTRIRRIADVILSTV